MPAVHRRRMMSLPRITPAGGPGPAARPRPSTITDARTGSKARDSRSGGPSPASARAWTRSCTWTRWARSTMPRESPGDAWHPHRGFETVTYMIDGTFRASGLDGGGGVITNGDTQWMTAGAGILHIEPRPEALVVSGGLFHGIQLWVNLPAADKWVRRVSGHRPGQMSTLLTSPDGGALVRLSPARSASTPGRGSPTPRSPWRTPPSPRRHGWQLPWDRGQRTGLRPGRRAAVGTGPAPDPAAGSSPSWAGDTDPRWPPEQPTGQPLRPALEVLCSAAARWRAGRTVRRSSIDPSRLAPGVRRFPEGRVGPSRPVLRSAYPM